MGLANEPDWMDKLDKIEDWLDKAAKKATEVYHNTYGTYVQLIGLGGMAYGLYDMQGEMFLMSFAISWLGIYIYDRRVEHLKKISELEKKLKERE